MNIKDELKKIWILLLYLIWSVVLFLQVVVWTSWRFSVFENALLETTVSVFQDLIWIPTALSLPFYLWYFIKQQSRVCIQYTSLVVMLAVFLFGLIDISSYFKYAFILYLLFFVFLLIHAFRYRSIRLDIVLYTLSVIALVVHYQTQLVPSLPSSDSAGHQIKVMSYNIMVRPTAERRRAIIELIHREKPDIVFIQEISRFDRNYFPQKLPQYPHQFWAAPYDNYNGGAILSRIPLEDKKNLQIKTDHMRSYTNLNYATVQSGGEKIHLLNFHFYPSGHPFIRFFNGEDTFSAFYAHARRTYTRRQSEANQVLRILSELPQKVIVAGDFNDTPGSRVYTRFSALLQNGFARAGWGIGATFGRSLMSMDFPGVPFFAFDFLRIDHVFCSPEMTVTSARVLGLGASDHRPQIVVLGF